MPEIIEQHRRFLPHFQAAEQIISLTWRLAFTLPSHLINLHAEIQEQLQELRLQKDSHLKHQQILTYTKKIEDYDALLGRCEVSEVSLCKPIIAEMLCTAFKFYDTNLYELHAYCLMPNHIHLLIKPLQNTAGDYHKLSTIVQRLKSYTAKEINHIIGKQGKVWGDDYFDRYIRCQDDYNNTANYILYNPVKAGLVELAENWHYSYYYDASLWEDS
ncbi:MAG: transposase [Candidatus Cloacimonetes bacterium]|nr:transposase [Candidatus Cloacimonadota bacterium]